VKLDTLFLIFEADIDDVDADEEERAVDNDNSRPLSSSDLERNVYNHDNK
jgi:hypothetical protein